MTSTRSLMMIVFTCVAACRIPTDHFIGIGGGDDAGGDDGGGTDGRGTDAPPAMVLHRGWIVDVQAGIYPVAKDPASGALTYTVGSQVSIQSPQSAIPNKANTHLFIAYTSPAAGPGIADYTIGANGMLTGFGGSQFGGCTPKYLALRPSGDFLAVSCMSPNVLIFRLNNGTIDATSTFVNQAVVSSPENVVWSADGQCLFAVDPNGGLNNNVLRFQFDGASSVNFIGNTTGPSNANGLVLHPNGQYLYVAGNADVFAYTVGAGCSLTFLQQKAAAATSGTAYAALTPNGARLFVSSGPDVRAYDVATNGMFTSSSTPQTTFPGFSVSHLAMDPAVPNLLYVTVPSGTFPATINSNGALTMGMIPNTGATNAVYFSMTP